jgi:uncharacterized membrane protein YcaP (DUF421 family)
MNPQELHMNDIGRIILGETPPSFLIEVIIRITIIYLLLMVSLRFLGKRMASMLSMHELTALVSLAAAIGIPLQAPDRGILPAILVATIVVLIHKGISKAGFKHRTFELLLHGDKTILIKDGMMDLQAMKKSSITRERLFAQLRSESIDSLGKIQRMYFEANGSFTFIKNKHASPGLSVIPDFDKDFTRQQKIAEGLYSCGSCGIVVKDQQRPKHKCERCQHDEWVEAVV